MSEPTREQLLACGSVTSVMRTYHMRHEKAKRLLTKHGIDYGHNNTSERNEEAAKKRKAMAMKIRRLKGKGLSDRKVAAELGMSVEQVRRTREEYEIGHSDERKK